MTGYTVHTGASKKFVSGWDRIFEAADAKQKDADNKQSKPAAKAKAKKKKSS